MLNQKGEYIMDNIKKEIAKSITYLMNEQNLSVESLSKLSTLSKKTIAKLLNCELEPTINMLRKICNVFSMNTCQFFDNIIFTNYLKCV